MLYLQSLFASFFEENKMHNHIIKQNNMKATWIWQHKNWPKFYWDDSKIITLLSRVRMLQGKLLGELNTFGFELQNNASLEIITTDVISSSEIEGIILDPARVRSSVASRLGLSTQGLPSPDHYTEGVVQVMMDAIKNYNEVLTKERLCNWHAALFPTGRSGMYKISVAEYRQGEEPMQIVSGAMGHEKVHYEAPSSSDIPHEMDLFLEWINKPCDIDPVIKAAIAHLWFVAIHPFDDGNGRLTRTITDMMLSRSDGQRLRFYSMSAEIMRKRNSYYEILQKTTTGDLCITDWLLWFFETMESAIIRSYDTLLKISQKAIFWQNNSEVTFNERQVKILNRLLDGFEGKLTTSKYAKICHTSQATALRDIQDLLERDILVKTESGGRSSGYEIK